MSKKPALFGFGRYPNVVAFASSTVTANASYEVATLPAVSLQTEEPSEVSRISTNNMLFTYWSAVFARPLTIGGMALVNVNLSPNGLVRFMGNTANPLVEEIMPASIAASSNAAGLVTSLDEGIGAPDANFVDPASTTAAWWVRLTFPTPVSLPTVGAHMGVFAVRVILNATATIYPAVTASLYESGVLVRSLGSRAATTATGSGQLFYFTFDPAELADPACTNIELRLDFTPGDNAGGGTPNRYVRLNTVSLIVDNYTASALTFDSGYLSAPGGQFFHPESDPAPTISVDYFLPADAPWTNLVDLLAYVLDDQTYHDPPVLDDGGYTDGMVAASVIVDQPSGFVQAGVFAAGPTLNLERAPVRAPESSVVVEGLGGGRTLSGQSYSADTYRYRVMSVDFMLTRTEKDELLSGIDFRRGKASAVYINLDPELSADFSEFTAGWVTAAEPGPAIALPVAYDSGEAMLYTKTYVFEEKL